MYAARSGKRYILHTKARPSGTERVARTPARMDSQGKSRNETRLKLCQTRVNGSSRHCAQPEGGSGADDAEAMIASAARSLAHGLLYSRLTRVAERLVHLRDVACMLSHGTTGLAKLWSVARIGGRDSLMLVLHSLPCVKVSGTMGFGPKTPKIMQNCLAEAVVIDSSPMVIRLFEKSEQIPFDTESGSGEGWATPYWPLSAELQDVVVVSGLCPLLLCSIRSVMLLLQTGLRLSCHDHSVNHSAGVLVKLSSTKQTRVGMFIGLLVIQGCNNICSTADHRWVEIKFSAIRTPGTSSHLQ